MAKIHTVFAKDFLGWRAYAALKAVLQFLPGQVAYALAALTGRLLYLTSARDRSAVMKNLTFGMGLDKARARAIAPRIFTHFCMNIVDFFRFEKFDESWFSQCVEVSGQEHINAALQKGKGVIAIGAHQGNYELEAYMMKLSGVTMNGVWASHKDPRIEAMFLKPRLEKGIQVILTGGAMEQIRAALARNEVVCFLIDYSYNRKGIRSKFFNHEITVPTGVALAALETGAPIVPFGNIRVSGRKFKFFWQPEVPYQLSGDREKDVPDIMSASLNAVEHVLRPHPEQWILIKDCWREDAGRKTGTH